MKRVENVTGIGCFDTGFDIKQNYFFPNLHNERKKKDKLAIIG